ncbi:MAG: hypothetical protein HY673_10850 [Chloroflexi bacterium]|nr:hypothetical protein [Chloroflexota bacterium]
MLRSQPRDQRLGWFSDSNPNPEKETVTYDFLDRLTQETNFLFNFGDTGDASSHANGQITAYIYDTFWRPTQVIRPGDFAHSSPTIRHYYESWGSTGQQNVYTVRTTSTPNNVWTKRFFDGLGRVVQAHSSGNTSKTMVTTTTFSDRGLVRNEYVPQEVFSTSLSGYKARQAVAQAHRCLQPQRKHGA